MVEATIRRTPLVSLLAEEVVNDLSRSAVACHKASVSVANGLPPKSPNRSGENDTTAFPA